MHYTVYKITNTANGRIYVGVHRTENPHDSYLGSGNLAPSGCAARERPHGKSREQNYPASLKQGGTGVGNDPA